MIVRQRVEDNLKLTFMLPSSEGEVSVVGTFNGWDPEAHPLKPNGDQQSVAVLVPANERVEFRYLGSEGRWFDDPDARPGENGNGVIDANSEPNSAVPAEPASFETGVAAP